MTSFILDPESDNIEDSKSKLKCADIGDISEVRPSDVNKSSDSDNEE